MRPITSNTETQLSSEIQLSPDELIHISRLVTIGELSSCFAHEVFNPLMMMRGHLRFAEDLMLEGDPLRSHFEVIDRAVKRIEAMAKRILDFSRKRNTTLEFCNVRELIEETLRFVQPYVHANMVIVELEIDPVLDEIAADRFQFIQVFVNLIQNAADAMTGCSRRVLTISAHREDDEVRIAFADTGRGMDSSDMDRIFTPFFTTKGELGTGLGLYISRRVVEEHHGTITVQTSAGGTTFTISLPFK